VEWPGDAGVSRRLLTFDQRGTATVVADLAASALALAFGRDGTRLSGLLFVSTTTGDLFALDTTSLKSVRLATGGDRGAFLAAGADGRLYIGGTNGVDVLFPAKPPEVIASDPVNNAGIAGSINRATITFDASMFRGALTDIRSVTNPANYQVIDTVTGVAVPIGAALYDPETRTVTLVFDSLAPSSYELRVLSSVQDELGNALISAYSSGFSVVQDQTPQLSPGLEFANTRIDRAAGTFSYDVRLTNVLGTTLVGPVRVLLDGIFAQGLSVINPTGHDANGVAFIDLLPSSGSLAAGDSTPWKTLTISNPQGIVPDTVSRVAIGVAPESRPAFISTPGIDAAAGQQYLYRAAAVAPAGAALSYVLISGPNNAILDPATGLLTWAAPSGGNSSVHFEVRAIGADGSYARQVWNVGVSGLNRPPVLTSVIDRRITTGQLLSITFSAVDPESSPITYVMENLPPGATFDAPSRTLRWIPAGNQAGVYADVRIRASDGVNDVTKSFQITVLPGNLAPEFTQPVDRTVTEGTTLTFALRGTDPEGKDLTYTSTNLPSGAVLVPSTGQFIWTPLFNQHGVYTVVFTASDGQMTTQRTVVLTVLNVNGPLQFTPLDTLVVREGQLFNIRVIALDPNVANVGQASGEIDSGGAQATVTYQITGLPTGATYNTTTHLLSWTPTFAQSGSYNITFVATNDGDGGGVPVSATQTIRIDVADTNGTPVVDPIANKTVAVGGTIDIPVRAVDPDAGPVTLTAEGLPSFATLIDNGNGTGIIRVTPLAGNRGNYTVTIKATDNGNGLIAAALTGSASFILSATAANEPPVLEVVGNKVALIGQALIFNVRVSDPDQDPLTWAAANLPAGALFAGTNVYGVARFTWTPGAGDAGDHTITLSSTDSGNNGLGVPATASETIHIVVRSSNQAPVLNAIGNQVGSQTQSIVLNLGASDPDNDSLTFTVTGLPVGAAFNARTGLLVWTPDYAQVGNFTITFGVTDGNLSDAETVTFNIAKVNRAPYLATPPPILGQEGLRLSFLVAGGDLDGDPLVYFVENLPAGATFNSDTRIFVWTPNYSQAGVYEIVFKVQDSSGARGSATALVQILNVNRPPVFPTPDTHQIVAGNVFQTNIVASDPDGNPLYFSIAGMPPGAAFNTATGVFTWTPVGAQIGRYDIPVTVTDGLASVTQLLSLVVKQVAAAPTVRIELTPSFPVAPGANIVVQVTASGTAPVRSLALTINGVAQTLDSFGRVTFRPLTPGIYAVVGTATDADGFIGRTTTEILVRDPGDRSAPVITLDNVPAGVVLTAPLAVLGSVIDGNLASWQLTLTPVSGGTVTILNSSRIGAAAGSTLGQINPGDFGNGAYTLTLTATDISGRTASIQQVVEINTPTKPGAYVRLETDFTLTLGGITIPVARRYSSLDASTDGSFGFGWQFVLADPRITTNVAPTGREVDGFYAAFTRGTRVYLTLPDGSRAGFTFAPEVIESGDRSYFRPAWKADAGVAFILTSGTAVLRETDGAFFQVGTGLPYNPASGRFSDFDYSLSAPDGTRFVFTIADGLREIWGVSGQRVVWTDSGIVAADGSRVSIERNSDGRIGRIVGPDGTQALYDYDSSGNLLQATILESGARTWLGYRATQGHLLTEVAGANAQSVRYDANGLLLGVDAVRRVLGTTAEFVGTAVTGAIAAGGTDRLAIVLGKNELATAQSGRVTIGIEVTSADGWQPVAATIRGMTAGFTREASGRSLALFTFDTAGPYVVELTGAGGASGAFTVSFFLAGDANGDGAVDGVDQTIFNGAFNTVAGQAGFVGAADWNRDGAVNDGDRAYLDAGAGFVGNRAPTVNAGTFAAISGNQVLIDLSTLAVDPDGDLLHFLVGAPVGGALRLIDGGRRAIFIPTPGMAGTATFTLQADDGALRSAPATITINVTQAIFTRYRIEGADAVVAPGATSRFRLVGDYAGGTIELDPSTYSVVSSNVGVVSVGLDGTVLGVGAGFAIVEFRINGGGSIAAAITVGPADSRLIEIYPESYILIPGATRQMVVRESLEAGMVSRASASDGTRYFVSDPTIATITADGLLTALRAGSVTVTVINGGWSLRAAFVVAPAVASGATVGVAGGVVQGDGIIVGLPGGALSNDQTVTVRSVAQSEIPLAMPDGWTFAGGLQVGFGSNTLNGGVTIDMPAPIGSHVGQIFYFMQPGTLKSGNDQPDEQIWIIMDTLVVGVDGRMRTTSPPNLGAYDRFAAPGAFFVPSQVGMAAVGSPTFAGVLAVLEDFSRRVSGYNGPSRAKQLGQLKSLVTVQSVLGAGGDGPRYGVWVGPYGDVLIPLAGDVNYSVDGRFVEPSGLVRVGISDVRVAPGQIVTYGLPYPPRYVVKAVTPPTITQFSFDFGITPGVVEPRLVISGENLLLVENPYPSAPEFLGDSIDDLFVTIEIGGRDTFDFDGKVLPVGGRDIVISGSLFLSMPDANTLVVKLPDGAFVAGGYVTVNRKTYAPLDGEWEVQVLPSNPAQLIPNGHYTFAVNSGDNTISAIDSFNTVVVGELTQLDPVEVARITLSTIQGFNPSPRNSTYTSDGTRLYVALNGVAGVAVIDVVALHEIDADAAAAGIQHIALPTSARPFDLVAEKSGRFLYVSDEANPVIYVIDIDPFSKTFNQQVQTISVGPAPLNLRGIALNSDDTLLFVTAPGRTLFGGYGAPTGNILIIDTKIATRGKPAMLFPDASSIEVGPEPYDITATDDPNVMLFVDRFDDSRGVGILRRTYFGPVGVWAPEFVDIRNFGLIPRLIEGRLTQVFGVSNASSITFVAANAMKDIIGEHPSYAFITGYNKFVLGDPKHDSSIQGLETYNYDYVYTFTPEQIAAVRGVDPAKADAMVELNGKPIGVPIVAGGNVGVIRNPLGSFADPVTRPRLVAATTPVIDGFPEGIAVAPGTFTLYAGFQTQNRVFAYDASLMVKTIEEQAKGAPIASFSQIGEPLPIPDSLSHLLRGRLSSVPIDVVVNGIMLKADYFGYLNGPDGPEGNTHQPIPLGRLPRGLAAPPLRAGTAVQIAQTPYNQSPTLNSYPNTPLTLPVGLDGAADAHTGALELTHALVSYAALGAQQGFTLRYDSLRAQPLDIYYFAVSALPKDSEGSTFIVRLTLRNDQGVFLQSDGLSAADAVALGLSGHELFFDLPATIAEGSTFGAGIPIDLTEAPTGLYTMVLEYGLFKKDAEGKYTNGRFFTFTQPYTVVNSSKEGNFGAGWGLTGLLEIYAGDGGVMVADGSGREEIFIAPEKRGDAFTALSASDYSDLRQKVDGTFILTTKYGTEYEFNSDGKMSVMRDRNLNATVFEWSKDLLLSITDSVNLVTRFTYAGSRVTSIIDPAGRVTRLEYSGNNLSAIIDPDGSKESFDYKHPLFPHLITSITHKRGNDPAETSGLNFVDKVDYSPTGRVIGGKRVDGKVFTMTPAQLMEVADLKLASDPAKHARTVELGRREGKDNLLSAKALYTDYEGRLLTYTMTGYGQFKSSKDAEDGILVSSDRRDNKDGYVTKITDGAGNPVEYEYDDFGNLVKKIDHPDGPGAAGVEETWEYNLQWSLPTRHVDTAGREFVYTLDSHGNLLTTVITDRSGNVPAGSPNTVTLGFTYYTNGLLKSSTDGEGHTTTFGYDGFGRPTTTAYADGSSTTAEYSDRTGNQTARTDEVGVRTTASYDPMNRQTDRSVASADGAFNWHTVYDAEGDVVRTVDSNGHVNTMAYDQLNRLTLRVIDAGGVAAETAYGYDRGSLSTPYAVAAEKFGTYMYMRDPNGNTTAQVFDKNGRLRFEYDAVGAVLERRYDKAGRMVLIKNPDGGVIVLTVDGRGRVTHQTGPTKEDVTMSYDGANRVIREVIGNDRNGGNQTVLTTYNLFDKPGVVTDPEGNVTRYEYDNAGNVTKRIQAAGSAIQFTSTYTYDSRNRELTTTVGGLATVYTTYFADGQAKNTSDPRDSGYLNSFEYDALKRIVRLTDAEGNVWKSTFDGQGNLLTKTDPRGASYVTTYVYDGANRPIRETNAEGETTTYEYDKAGNRTVVVSPRGARTVTAYNSLNQVTQITDALNGITTFTYDVMGQLITTTDPRGSAYVTTNSYDRSGRLLTVTDAAGRVTTYARDQVGNIYRVTPAQGESYRTDYVLDRLNRIRSTTAAGGTADEVTTRMDYNAMGFLQQSQDGLGRKTVYVYDSLNHLKSLTEAFGTPDATTWNYVYDAAGQLVSETDPRGAYYTTVHRYDKIGREVSVTTPSGTPADNRTATVFMVYDAVGNVVSLSDPRGPAIVTLYTYDRANRLLTRTTPAGATTFTYDKHGNVATITDAEGHVTTYTYDLLNRRTAIREADGSTTTYVFDAAGQVRFQFGPRNSVGGPLTTEWRYDVLGRLTQVTDPAGNTTSYTYDAGDNALTTTDVGGYTTTVTRDFLHRVTRMTHQVGGGYADVVESYTYDKAGNRLSSTDARGLTTNYLYNNLDRLVRLVEPAANNGGPARETVFAYDAVGNRISVQDPRGAYYTTRYTYDAANRLVREERPEGSPAQPEAVAVYRYVYDQAGGLTAAIDPRSDDYVTRYFYDDAGRISRIERPQQSPDGGNASSVETFTYDRLGNVLTRTGARGAGYVTSYTYDERNRIATVTDPDGNVTSYVYDEESNLIRYTETDQAAGTQRIFVYTYDAMRRRVSETINGTFTTTWTYDSLGRNTRTEGPFSDANGVVYVETQSYDGLGRILFRTDRVGNTIAYTYDAAGNVLTRTDPRGVVISQTYTPAGLVASTSQPSGAGVVTTSYVYDAVGNVVTEIDPRGAAFATTTTYDAQNRPLSRSMVVGGPGASAVTTYRYDAVGNLVSATDPLGRTTTKVYDAQSRVVRINYEAGSAGSARTVYETFAYDADGNLLRQRATGGDAFVTVFEYDRLGRLAKTTDAEGQVVAWLFNRWGNIIEDRSPDGTLAYTYDLLNRPLTITDEGGARTVYNYFGNRSVTEVTDPIGHKTLTQFDGLGRLVNLVDAAGGVSHRDYDAAGNVVLIVDPRGVRTVYEYDARNLKIKETRAAGTAEAVSANYTYDVIGRLVSATDFRGVFYVTTYTYDGLGRRIEMRQQVGTEEEPLEAITAWEYDLVGNVTAEIDPRGFRTEFIYEARNLLIEIDEPDGPEGPPVTAVTTNRYDDAGRLIELISPLGHVTTFEYDKVGRPTKRVIATQPRAGNSSSQLVTTWTYAYVANRFRMDQIMPDGLTVTTFYDLHHRAVRIEDPASGVTLITYDAAGNVLTRTNGRITTTYTYDALNRLKTVVDGAGQATTYNYDAAGNLLDETDALGHRVSYVYDFLGRMRQNIDAAGGITEQNYDAMGHVISVTGALGAVQTFTYDGRGLVRTETNATGTRTYSYDEMGNLVEATDRDDRVRRFEYDRANRVVSEQWLDGPGNVVGEISTTYDLEGRITSISDGTTTVEREYTDDTTARLLLERMTIGGFSTTVRFTPDDVGRPLEITLQAGAGPVLWRNVYGYESLTGRLASIRQDGSFVTPKAVYFTYQPDISALATLTRVNGAGAGTNVATTTYTLDNRGIITRLEHRLASGVVVNAYDLTYSGNSQLVTRVSADGTATYVYDVRNQLVAVNYTDPLMPDESYTYDAAGNRIASHRQPGYVIGVDNQVESTGNEVFTYDNEGNITRRVDSAARRISVYTWDYRNRLVSVAVTDYSDNLIRTVNYTYDGLDRRVREEIVETIPTSTTTARYFIYVGNAVMMEFLDADGIAGPGAPLPDIAYLRGTTPDMILAQDGGAGGQVYWHLSDQQGTVRDLINNAGVVVDHVRVDAFGVIVSRSNANIYQRHFFIGREWDSASQLYYMHARYYDALLGRFISQDPIGLGGGDTNVYRYSANDPVNSSDPSGLQQSTMRKPGPNNSEYSTNFVDVDAEYWHSFWISFSTFGSSRYDIRTVGIGKDSNGHKVFAAVGETVETHEDTWLQTSGKIFWTIPTLGFIWAHAEGVDNLSNMGRFYYGLGKGFWNIGKEFINIGADVIGLFGGTKDGFQSNLFKVSENITGPLSLFQAIGTLAISPFVGLFNFGKAFFSGDVEKAGEELAGILPLPTGIARSLGSKSAAVKAVLKDLSMNFAPPLFDKMVAGGVAAAPRIKGAFSFLKENGFRAAVKESFSAAKTSVKEAATSARSGLSHLREPGVAKGLVQSGWNHFSDSKNSTALAAGRRGLMIGESLLNRALGKRSLVAQLTRDAQTGANRLQGHTDFVHESTYFEARSAGASHETALSKADGAVATERAAARERAGTSLEVFEGTRAGAEAWQKTIAEGGSKEAGTKAYLDAYDQVGAAHREARSYAENPRQLLNRIENAAEREWAGKVLDTLEDSSLRDVSHAEFLDAIGADKSLVEGVKAGDPHATAVAFMLREAKDQVFARVKIYDLIFEGRKLEEFRERGLVPNNVWEGLERASNKLEAGQELAVYGSYGTDVMTFANRYQLMDAMRNGFIKPEALMAAYGRGGEAAALGRILPDITKPGGPFSPGSGDFDLALLSREGLNKLPGSEAIEMGKVGKDPLATAARDTIFSELPSSVHGHDVDMKYATFENGSLRGYTSSYRGRATFANGKFQGRVQSIMYGEGGALVRDFSFLFNGLPQKAQAGINSWVNVENVQRVGAHYFSGALDNSYYAIDISNRFATFNSISDIQNGRGADNNAVGSGYFGAIWSLTRPEGIRFVGQYIAAGSPGTAPVSFNGTTLDLGTYVRPPVSVPAPAPTAASVTTSSDTFGGDIGRWKLTAGGTISGPALNLLAPASVDLNKAWAEINSAARAAWSEALGLPVDLEVELVVDRLDAGVLGYAEVLKLGSDGRPLKGRITIDAMAAGRGWFVDPTPTDSGEFGNNNSEVIGHYDLYSFVLHEMGHLLGFAKDYSGFAAGVTSSVTGTPHFDFGGVQAALSSDGEHLDPSVYPNALMNGYLAIGVREKPTALEGSLIRQAWYLAAQQAESGFGGPSFEDAAGHLGYVELENAVQQALANPPVSILNGDFGLVSGSGTPSNWNVFGNVLAIGNNAVLTSVPGRLYTDLSQTFLVPAAASRLEFTLTAAQLLQVAGHPGDAFEMALLNATTSLPLFSRAISGTDALISLQANGQLYLAPQVGIKGQPGFTSGSVVDTSQPLTFTIDLSVVTPNTPLTIYFDLISVNGAGSRVNISNVRLPLIVANNQAPVALPDSAATDSNAPVLINVLGNDTDSDGTIDPTSLIIVGAPAHGKVTRDAITGFLLYTPALYFSGADSFSYRVRDNDGALSNIATVSITIRRIPLAPAAVDDNYTVPQGRTLTSNVLGNDVSPNGLPITAVLATGPAHGALVLNADGSFTYTPDALYSGLDAFTYRATDGTLTSGAATVRISVTRISHAPVAVDDIATVVAGGTVVIPVTANDINIDGDSLLPVIVTMPVVGTATVNAATGSIIYTAPAGFSGVVTLTYRDFNTFLQSAIATVTITVLPSGRQTGAVDDAFATNQGLPVSGNVLANDIPLSGQPMRPVLVQGPAHGTLILNANGSFTYTPAASFIGIDAFTYYDTDGTLISATARVTITVNPPNRAPVAVADNFTLDQRTRLIGNVVANDRDPDGDPIHVALVRGPVGGTVQLNSNGAFVYTPTGDFYGADSFTYVVDDGKVVGNTVTVTLTIRYVNRPPIATAGSYNVDPFAEFAANLTTYAVDPDGDPLIVRLVNGPSYGNLVLSPDGTFTYRGSPLNPGFDSFTYQVGDGQSFSEIQTITINFTRRLGVGYFIREFWGLSAPGAGDAVTELLRTSPARSGIHPLSTNRAPANSGGVDGVYLVRMKILTLPLRSDVSHAVSVTVLSIHADVSGDSLPAALISASLADGKLTFTFDPSLPSGAYNLVVRFTFADGSTIDQNLTVYLASQ